MRYMGRIVSIICIPLACIVFFSGCSSRKTQWENVIQDIQLMRITWAKGDPPITITDPDKRYGAYKSIPISMHVYFQQLTRLDNRTKFLLKSQEEWISRDVLIRNERSDEIQKKAATLSNIYIDYLNITANMSQNRMLDSLNLDTDLKDEYRSKFAELNADVLTRKMTHMKLVADYFDKINLLLQFTRGKIIIGEKIIFKKPIYYKQYNDFASEIVAIAAKIDIYEKDLAKERDEILRSASS